MTPEEEIHIQQNDDGSYKVLKSPDWGHILAAHVGRAPIIQVTPDVLYIDAVNPKLYRIVGREGDVLEVRRFSAI